ncbi:UDP-glycosyltransferase 83A1 [Capsicum chacoense]|uniref:UDP-glycosyltransferase 83A1 n=1 Tax=Capsicum annuum TaxID=4072 RepID=UPI001FB08082|nr:UDP-glycosyltransferase 83A1 [Capsicum annuum]
MGKLHILMIPYPVQGHVIPFMQLAQSLAKYGFKITFAISESSHMCILNSLSGKNSLHDQIHLISVLDESESGDKNVPGSIFEAIFKVMPRKIEKLIQENNTSEVDQISCVIADLCFGWAMELAEKMRIKRATFITAAAANLLLGFNIPELIDDGIIDNDGTPAIKDRMFQFEPTMPIMNSSDLVWTSMGNLTMQKLIFDMMVHNNKAMKSADWLICNSTYDLEPGAFKLAPEIVPIGPLLFSNYLELSTLPPEAEPSISSKESPNSQAGSFLPEDFTCLNWLDQQPLCSVVYVAFGSTTIFNEAQFQELSLGLELSNKPFLWVVRTNATNAKINIFLKSFVDRIGRQKGKIVSWAPQQKVLSHPSVGCFVSHCGWNSTIEAISNGVPILCWPYFADQFMNKSYICDIWKVGLGLQKVDNEIISCGEIKDKMEHLLGNDAFKKRALKLKEMTMNSVKEGGRSRQNLINFFEWIKSS